MNRSFQGSQGFWIFLIGIGIGWLAGLSLSAVVGGIITALLSICAGIVGGLQTVRLSREGNENDANQLHVDARPLAVLVLGIALSAPCGILARTYHILEPHEPQAVSNKDQIQFESSGQSVNSEKQKMDVGALFGVREEECTQVLNLARMGNYKAFSAQLQASTIPFAQEMNSRFQDDPHNLALLVKIICTCSGEK